MLKDGEVDMEGWELTRRERERERTLISSACVCTCLVVFITESKLLQTCVYVCVRERVRVCVRYIYI